MEIKNNIISYLTNGKIVLIARESKFVPEKPGKYYISKIIELERVAFATLLRTHYNSVFDRSEAFSHTDSGKAEMWGPKYYRDLYVPFIFDVKKEHLECLGITKIRLTDQDGWVDYYTYDRIWKHKNRYGLPKLSDETFYDAKYRANSAYYKAHNSPYNPSSATIWSYALEKKAVSYIEYEEAVRRYGKMWHYCGD